jgi:hypothetical protein
MARKIKTNKSSQRLAILRLARKKLLPQPDKAAQLLVSLVNAKFDTDADVVRARAQTKQYWPDLWGWIDDLPGEGERRALRILDKIQRYLQRFWTSKDPYEQDWLIHRIRDYHSRHLIQPKTKSQREELDALLTVDDTIPVATIKERLDAVRHAVSILSVAIEQALDETPRRTPFAESLYFLQLNSDKAKVCRNKACPEPYFIAAKKKQQDCLLRTCANDLRRAYKKEWWSTHPEAAKRRREKRQESRKEIERAKRNDRKT